MNQLNIEDIDFLIEAADAWKAKKVTQSLLSGLMLAVLVKDEDESQKAMDAATERAREIETGYSEKDVQTALVRAKLVEIKRQMIVNNHSSDH